jgi:hypothetical protein
MAPKKQVSPAIRMLRGERDASARATHLEAATRKFLVTTNERKQMSTKTNFKRIALVAVAALGLGVLSSVPTQAAIVDDVTVTTTNGAVPSLGRSDSTTAATIAVSAFAEGTADTIGVVLTLGTQPSTGNHSTAKVMVTFLDTALASGGVVSPAGMGAVGTAWGVTAATIGIESLTATTAKPVVARAAENSGRTYAKFGVFLDSATARVAGTYTVDYVVRGYSGGAAPTTSALIKSGTLSIVVTDGALAAAGAVSAAGTSTAVMTAASPASGDDSGVTAVVTPTGNAIANITVTQKTAAGLPSRESITVTTNIGNVGSACTSAAKNITIVGAANGINTLVVCADGTSGTAKITVKTTSVTFSVKTVTFYSTVVDKITAVQLGATLGGTSTAVIAATATDAAGNKIIANSSVYAFSSDLTVINTGASAGTECTYDSTLEVHLCSLAGSNDGTAVITLRDKSTTALSTKASGTVSIKVNTKAPASLKMAFDKATYAPGEAAYVRIWAVDAAGNPVAPGARTAMLTSAGITSTVGFGNGTITDSLTVNSVSPTLGFTTAASRGYASTEPIYLVKVFMPATGGAVKVSATGGTLFPLSGQVEVSATATVTNDAAAALAAVNALATTVASLRTLITTLTNLVLKIQKKVRA